MYGFLLNIFGSSSISYERVKGVKRELRHVQKSFEEVSKKVLVCFKTIFKKASGVT